MTRREKSRERKRGRERKRRESIFEASVSSNAEEFALRLCHPAERNLKRLRKCLHASRHVSPPSAAASPCPAPRRIPAATPLRTPAHVHERYDIDYTCALDTRNVRAYTRVYEDTKKTVSVIYTRNYFYVRRNLKIF